jgi:hypothetical protein
VWSPLERLQHLLVALHDLVGGHGELADRTGNGAGFVEPVGDLRVVGEPPDELLQVEQHRQRDDPGYRLGRKRDECPAPQVVRQRESRA